MKINILGTEYTVEERNAAKDEKLKAIDGYCDTSTKFCVVDDMSTSGADVESKGDLVSYKRQLKRHELIHAFLSESGLDTCSEWATNEEMVDWLAIQFPKIAKAFETVGCM